MITSVLRDAVVRDLKTISKQNGFEIDVVSVLTKPKAIRDLALPAIAVISGPGGRSDPEELTNGTGRSSQQFVVQFAARNQDDMDAVTDAARNALEKDGSFVSLVSGVEMATLTEWSDPIYEDEYSVVLREATVEIRYVYSRGSA